MTTTWREWIFGHSSQGCDYEESLPRMRMTKMMRRHETVPVILHMLGCFYLVSKFKQVLSYNAPSSAVIVQFEVSYIFQNHERRLMRGKNLDDFVEQRAANLVAQSRLRS